MEWTPVDTTPRIAHIPGIIEPGPRVESFTVAEWPNALGDTPLEAIGKEVRITEGDITSDFVISHLEGERLCLRRVGKADFSWGE